MKNNYYEMNLERAEKQFEEMEKLTDKFLAYNEVALLMTHHQTISCFIQRAFDNEFIILGRRSQQVLAKINRYVYNRI